MVYIEVCKILSEKNFQIHEDVEKLFYDSFKSKIEHMNKVRILFIVYKTSG